MAYIFGDGFDCYAAAADADDGYWDSGSLLFSFTAGRFSGSQAVQVTTFHAVTAVLAKASGANDAIHHLSFAVMQTATLTGTSPYWWFTLYDGATAQCSVVCRSDGAIILTAGASSGTTLATYTGAITATSTWYQFEVEVRVSNTAGYMIARKLGNTSNDFASATNLDTAATANDYANRLGIGMGTASGQSATSMDDLLWRSDSVANGVAWAGDVRCFTRRPSSDASVQWSPSAAAVPLTPFVQSTFGNSVSTTARYSPFTPVVTGTVGTINLATNAGNAGNIKCTIFSNSGGNTPGAILGSATTMSNTASGPVTFTFPSPVNVTAGTQYWIGWMTDTNVSLFWNQTASSAVGLQGTGLTYAAFPGANPGTSAGTSNIFTVYTTPTGVSGSNYGFVSEPQQDAATSYVYSSTVGQSDLYGISAISSTPASIVAVTTRAYLQKSDAGTRNTSVQLKSGSTTVSSASAALNTTFGWQARTDVVDPATGAAWTAVGVNNCTIGVIVTA